MPFYASAPDPYEFTEVLNLTNKAAQTRTLRNPSVLTGNVGVYIGVGQSLISNADDAVYTTVNTTKVHNLNVFDGGLYNAQAPLLGTNIANAGGHWLPRFADTLITDLTHEHVVLESSALGSTYVSDWAPYSATNLTNPSGIKAGGQYRKLLASFRRCDALGLTITGVLWQQGESDNAAGTTEATYLARLQEMIAAIRAEGHNAKWFVGKSTYTTGTTSTAVRNACTSIVNGTDIFAGADTDSLTGTNRAADGVHWSGTGSAACASRWVTAVEAVI